MWNKISEHWKEFREKPLKEVSDFLKGKKGKILDLGAGSGRHMVKMNAEFYEVDFSEKMLELGKKKAQKEEIKAQFVRAEAWDLPFDDDFFDSAIFIAALHCIPDEKKRKKSLEELHRVLKKKGKAMITVWGRKSERIKNRPKETTIPWMVEGEKYQRYCYIYDPEELKNAINKTGFKIISFEEKENLVAVVEKE